ncbi:MAG: hypothetical protein SWZ49_33850 [Cyanobacteriota bacterium]|nr:hypothetical protein [Cyanobacteriota bacterium]
MFRSYEAMIEDGKIKWLGSEPEIFKARVIVTILSDEQPRTLRRAASTSIAGKGKTNGNLVSPIVEEEDWECLK